MVLDEYIVVDIETTGLSKHRHKITEIAALHIRHGHILRAFATLVNPGTPIPSFITRLTGIDDHLVAHAPTIEQVAPTFAQFCHNRILVAHNATFDYGFLDVSCRSCSCVLEAPTLCTRLLANRLVPHLPSKKLQALCAHFGVINAHAHRAMSDVYATHAIVEKLFPLLEQKGVRTPNDALRFQRAPISQISR